MEEERIILGIDPGTNIMGYGIIRTLNKKMEMVQMGVIHLGKLDGHALKLKRIFERTVQLVDEYKPDEVSLEAPFYGKNVQSMLKLGRAQGVAMAAALYRDVPIFEYTPKKETSSILCYHFEDEPERNNLKMGVLTGEFANHISVHICRYDSD